MILDIDVFPGNKFYPLMPSPKFQSPATRLLVEALGVCGCSGDVSVTSGLVRSSGQLELIRGLEVCITSSTCDLSVMIARKYDDVVGTRFAEARDELIEKA